MALIGRAESRELYRIRVVPDPALRLDKKRRGRKAMRSAFLPQNTGSAGRRR